MNIFKKKAMIVFVSIITLLIYCNKNLKSGSDNFTEMQKKVIQEDKLNIKDGKAAVNLFSSMCKKNYNKSFYSESEGKLKHFDCSKTSLRDNEVKYLVFFPEITGIHLTGKGITDKSLEYFKNFKNINGFSLYDTNVTGIGFKYLKESTKMTIIRLEGSPFTDEGCKYLSEIKFEKSIMEADFSSTKITDEGLKCLSKINFYGTLNLKNTAITDEGLKYLANQKELGEVIVIKTKVTKKGIEWLKKQVPGMIISYQEVDY